MSHTKITSSIAIAAISIGLFGACSAESLTERAVSLGLEQAIDGEQDIDLNFDDENGGFSISTDEGDFSVNFNDEEGGIVFDTEDGSGVISFDSDGVVFDTDDGSGTITLDQENGSINFDTDEGSGSINTDEDSGALTFNSDDGQVVFGANETPDAWPAAIGTPATANPETSFFNVFNDGSAVQLMGFFEHDPNEPYGAQAEAGLRSLGYSVLVESNEDGGRFVQLTNGDSHASVYTDDTGYSTVSIATG